MGVYYKVVNLDRKESLKTPWAAKEFEWVNAGPAAELLAWVLFRRWNGDRIRVVNDAGAEDDVYYSAEWPNVYEEERRAYEAARTGREPPYWVTHSLRTGD